MNIITSRVLVAGAIAASTALVLVACGGGGGGAAVPGDALISGTDIPASAAASSDGARAFVASLVAAPTDAAEPLTVGDAVLASSDSSEPADL